MFLPLSVCVKSSEVLVSLVSCTINTESVLTNLRTTKTDRVSRCLLHLCTPCNERCSVQCTYCNVEVLYVVTTAIRLACSVSNITRLLGSVHVHMVSALYRILTGSFCRLTLYGLLLYPSEQGMPYRTNWNPCSVECTCTFA